MEIIKILDGVEALKQINNANVKINTALKISKNMDQAQKVLEEFQKRRDELLKELGDDPEKAPTEDQARVNSEIEKLTKEEVDFKVTKIPVSELEEVEITSALLQTIIWMIDEEDNS